MGKKYGCSCCSSVPLKKRCKPKLHCRHLRQSLLQPLRPRWQYLKPENNITRLRCWCCDWLDPGGDRGKSWEGYTFGKFRLFISDKYSLRLNYRIMCRGLQFLGSSYWGWRISLYLVSRSIRIISIMVGVSICSRWNRGITKEDQRK